MNTPAARRHIRHRMLRSTIALGAVATVMGAWLPASGTPAALAASPSGTPTSISDNETIQVIADAGGKITASRLLNQLEVTGNGHYVVSVPTATKGLRNLNGFSAPSVHGGNAVWDLNVHGKSQQRTVANLPQSRLPLTIQPSYTLDGRPIAAKDMIDKSGLLQATYVVSNISGVPQTITYRDGRGHSHPYVTEIVMPMVGVMTTTLPPSFHNVVAKFGTLAGDGRGATIATWQMVLFPPLGQVVQTLTYTAQLDHASLPAVTMEAIPVAPNGIRGTKYGEDQIKIGGNSARQVTQGGVQLDAGLVQLSDGAGQLLGGLNQLYAGAAQLSAGLAGQAAPGAAKLAAGLKTALAGGRSLAAGLHQLDAGTGQLQAGIGANLPSANLLASGAEQVSSGAKGLASSLTALAAGVRAAGIGSLPIAAGQTLGDALDQLAKGAGQLAGAAAQVARGTQQSASGLADLFRNVSKLAAGEHSARVGADQLSAGLGQLLTGGDQLSSGIGQAASGATQITAGLAQAKSGPVQIKQGLQQARHKGTATLMSSGNATAVRYGKEYAILQALDARAAHGGLLYPPPAGASGAAAYSFTLNAASHTASDNLTRGLLAILLLVVTCIAGSMLRRRMVHTATV